MIRVGAWIYKDLPSEDTLLDLLGEAAFSRLAADHREKAKQETLLGFALLTKIFSEADLLAVRRTDAGRPYFAGRPDVDFSISHCPNLVVCAVEVGDRPRVGIDAEPLAEKSADSMQRLSARWFSLNERKIWEKEPTEKRFLSIWTAKEAIVKHGGDGLRGLRTIDSIDSDLPLTLTAYSIGNAVVTLASEKGKCAPEQSEILLFP